MIPAFTCSCPSIDLDETQTLINEINFFRHHYFLKEKQKCLFHKQIEDLKIGQAQILFDFKENIHVNRGPVEVGQVYYNKSQRSLLGFGLLYKNEQNELICKYIDFISVVLNKDSLFVIDCLTELISKFIQPLPFINSLFVWTDCGKHFRSAEFAYFLLKQVPQSFSSLTNVNWNVFVEHHGKSPVDAHFSLLSRWLKEAEIQRCIHSTQELISALDEKALQHGRGNHQHKQIYFLEYKPPCGHDHENAPTIPPSQSLTPSRIDEQKVSCQRPRAPRFKMSIPEINCYYSFQNYSRPTEEAIDDVSVLTINDQNAREIVVTDVLRDRRSNNNSRSINASAEILRADALPGNSEVNVSSRAKTNKRKRNPNETDSFPSIKKTKTNNQSNRDDANQSKKRKAEAVDETSNSSHASSSSSSSSSFSSSNKKQKHNDLFIFAQVLPCCSWPSYRLQCFITSTDDGNELKLAPRLRAPVRFVSKRQFHVMQRRLYYDPVSACEDAHATAAQSEPQARVPMQVDSTDAEPVPMDIDDFNFTSTSSWSSSSPSITQATPGPVASTNARSTRARARSSQTADTANDLSIALALQQLCNTEASLYL